MVIIGWLVEKIRQESGIYGSVGEVSSRGARQQQRLYLLYIRAQDSSQHFYICVECTCMQNRTTGHSF